MPVNSKFDRTTEYFDIDGVLMIATRDVSGNPKGFIAQGNSVQCKLTQSVNSTKHKERQSGQRGTDIEVEDAIETGVEITIENAALDVLEANLRGSTSRKIAGTQTDEAIKYYAGIVPLANQKLTVLTNVKRGAQLLTAYVNDITPYDYKVNLDHGSLQFNDGSVIAMDKLTTGGTAPTVVTVGYPTVITVTNTAAVGDYAAFTGFAGADAALLNGKAFKITAASPTSVSLDVDTTGKTITLGTPLSIFSGQALTCTYTNSEYLQLDALVNGSQERWLRIEGLNRRNNLAPIVIDIFRFQLSPAQEFPLLGDENQLVTQFQMTGSMLSDATKSTGSKYYRVRK